MKTNLDIIFAALIFGIGGIGFIFLPAEILSLIGQSPTVFSTWALQCLGASYFGLAWMNYLNKNAPLGGIYGRPILLVNLMVTSPSFFFSMDAVSDPSGKPIYLGLTIVFGVLTGLFLFRMMGKGPTLEEEA